MFLSRLQLANFKNYESQRLDFSARLNCLTGLNGMGKTNVLDAIHLLCLCKSHSGLSDRNLVRHEASFYRIEGHFELQSGDQEKIVAKFLAGQSKEFERNGNSLERLSDHIGRFPVVMIAPDDVALVQEGSEDRRRFIDSTLSQNSAIYLGSLMTYNALLRQRNALLKSFAEHHRFDAALLESIDRQMPGPAAVVFSHRKTFEATLIPLFSDFYSAISGSRERVNVSYQSDLEENSMESLLTENLEKDRILQRTTAGVHKDDLRLFMNDLPVKKFASQGQLKSFLLALRLAQYEALRQSTGTAPILLLDDIFDKLDETRVRHLVGLLLERDFGQVFITDTQRNRIEAVIGEFPGDFRIFEVEN
ncbi:MAG: DNA replication/repair protein RecF, partial [Bacteroidota bacterium]